jgi:DNA end-binding protein Ku
VQAFNAESSERGDVAFNQLHGQCKSRVKYVKTCPIHGEIPNAEIVKGYEYDKGEYVIVDEEEIAMLRGEREQAVEIDTFIKPGSIDPKFFDGRTYYLMPDGPLAKKPYAVLLETLQSKGLWGVAVANISNRDRLVVLRAADGALCVETLHYAAELRSPAEIWNGLELPKVDREEARLAAMLVEASTSKSLDLRKYKDDYNEKMRALLEAKVEGREIVVPPKTEPVPVINLMDALKQSLKGSGKVAAARQVAKASLSRAAAKPRQVRRKRTAG